jgi:hypothetical protein
VQVRAGSDIFRGLMSQRQRAACVVGATGPFSRPEKRTHLVPLPLQFAAMPISAHPPPESNQPRAPVDRLKGKQPSCIVSHLSDSTWMFRHTRCFCLRPGVEIPRFVPNLAASQIGVDVVGAICQRTSASETCSSPATGATTTRHRLIARNITL